MIIRRCPRCKMVIGGYDPQDTCDCSEDSPEEYREALMEDWFHYRELEEDERQEDNYV